MDRSAFCRTQGPYSDEQERRFVEDGRICQLNPETVTVAHCIAHVLFAA
jgi:hypothetical protein